MKTRKRILAAVLAGAMAAASLAGCGGNVSSQTGASNTASANTASSAASPSGTGTTGDGKLLLASAELPAKAKFPVSDQYFDRKSGEYDREQYKKDSEVWNAARSEREALAAAAKNGYNDFLTDLSKLMLADKSIDNPAFSPLNIYISLGMLAEVSEGETRAQILKAAHAGSLDGLYETANALARAARREDDAQTVTLGGSLWLADRIPFSEAVVKKTAERYFSSIYHGKFGTEAMDQALRDWLNEKTGGLLRNQVNDLKFDDPNLAMVLAATIYLKAVWADEFSEKETEDAVFHGKAGDKEVPFMKKSDMGTVYYGGKFSAIRKEFVSGGGMYLILPNEGVSPEELLDDAEAKRFVTGEAASWKNTKNALVHLSMPKYDVTSEYDLRAILRQMGIVDAFDSNKANFSSLTTDGTPLFVNKAMHDARVKVNEHGVEAAAFTVYMLAEGAALPDEEVDFTLDRPFLYVVEGDTGIPLFVGAVNKL